MKNPLHVLKGFGAKNGRQTPFFFKPSSKCTKGRIATSVFSAVAPYKNDTPLVSYAKCGCFSRNQKRVRYA